MISDQRIKAEMDKKKDKDQNWLEHNFAMAKIEFSKVIHVNHCSTDHQEQFFISANPEGLRFLILTIVPRA